MTEDFILKELNRSGVSKSTGLDGLPARFMKDGAEFLINSYYIIYQYVHYHWNCSRGDEICQSETHF